MPDSNTGFATLPDIGALAYNGITFSQLYRSKVAGRAVPDNAGRTVKWMEYTITVEGVITLSPGADTVDDAWVQLRRDLDQQAGQLFYTGKGFGPLEINTAGGIFDVNWGPKPKTLDFQPLGSSRSALITWTVTTCIPEIFPAVDANGGKIKGRVVQFNYDSVMTYGDDGYSSWAWKGTLEIPMTRLNVDNRTIPTTVDAYRKIFLDWEPDLRRFRVTNRSFNISRDKRTMEWAVAAEELPPMGPPGYHPIARGNYTVRPVAPGPGLASWMCTLRTTHTVRKDYPRRTAWWAHISLVHQRMWESRRGAPAFGGFALGGARLPVVGGALTVAEEFLARFFRAEAAAEPEPDIQRAFIWNFSIDEGIYLDSKTITFETTWRLISSFTQVLLASGLWVQSGLEGGNLWANSIQDISGANSWLTNLLDPNDEVIVDMGGP